MHSCTIYYIAVIHFRTLYCILFHQEYFLAHIAHQVGVSDHLGTLLSTAKKQFNALLVSSLLNKKENNFYLWSRISFKHVENCRKYVKKRCQHVLVARHAMQWGTVIPINSENLQNHIYFSHVHAFYNAHEGKIQESNITKVCQQNIFCKI